jgi:hypothetical protein
LPDLEWQSYEVFIGNVPINKNGTQMTRIKRIDTDFKLFLLYWKGFIKSKKLSPSPD